MAGRYKSKDCHRIAVISDLHYGSRYQQATRLKEFLDYAVNERNAEMILCAGDICDGLRMRPHHDLEVFLHSGDDIVSYIADEFPDHGIKLQFISGNHDHSIWKQAGIDIGRALEMTRSDFRYLGFTKADLIIPGGVHVRLYHGAGGCGQVRSSRIQKQSLRALEECLAAGKEPPAIFLAGHCHSEATIHNHFNMFLMSLPCFQGQTPYLSERGMVSQIGGVVLEYQADGQGLTSTPKADYQQYSQLQSDYPGWNR